MRIFALLALCALAFSPAASAQTGRSGMSTSTPLTNVRAYEEFRAFGRCIARTRRKDALAVIATLPGSPEEHKVLDQVAYREHSVCMFGGTKMQMPDIFARGTIAEGLFLSDGVPESYRLTAPSPGEARDLHGVARCYTHGHRAEVQALLALRPGSSEELKAVGELWEDFRTCMPNFNVRLNAPWIRFLLAEAILRLPPALPAAAEHVREAAE